MNGLGVLKNFFKDEHLVIFDVGAHKGYSVDAFNSLFPDSKIFAFEPDSKNFQELQSAFKNNQNVSLVEAAISSKNGVGVLHANNYDATHSLLEINPGVINLWGDSNDFLEISQNEIPLTTLDNFCTIFNISRIDILKIDIQGGELEALKGAETLLLKGRISAIFLEVEFRELYIDQPLFWDINHYLNSIGYKFVSLVEPKITSMGVMSWADAIYVCADLWSDIEKRHIGHNQKVLEKS
jgi:FkbM family methyltransferase